jgi:hypothetical protein
MLAHALNNAVGLAALWWSGARWFGFAAAGFLLAAPLFFYLGNGMLPPLLFPRDDASAPPPGTTGAGTGEGQG